MLLEGREVLDEGGGDLVGGIAHVIVNEGQFKRDAEEVGVDNIRVRSRRVRGGRDGDGSKGRVDGGKEA